MFGSVGLIYNLCNVGQTNINDMKILVITREQFEMMDSDPINSIKLILLLVAIVFVCYYLNSFYKWVKNLKF